MNTTITETNFQFPQQIGFYRGKVREVYIFPQHLAVVASDRISAFDVILPRPIPYKGQVLNQISAFFLQQTAAQVPNWLEAMPDPSVSIGKRCTPIPLEMVIRGHLCGTAWRAYKAGQRVFNGQQLSEGLRENDILPTPIITPATKAEQGAHDEDINTDEILARRIVSPEVWEQLAHYTRTLFALGQSVASRAGLLLADTKYEFGYYNGQVLLIDEIHTPDSSRYFDAVGFEERQSRGEAQRQRSKELVRQWLLAHGFQGQTGAHVPEMSDDWVERISREYISIYEQITGQPFVKPAPTDRLAAIEQAIQQYLTTITHI